MYAWMHPCINPVMHASMHVSRHGCMHERMHGCIQSSLVVKPGGTPLKIRVRIMISAVRIMISAVRKIQGGKMIQSKKVPKIIQNQRLKRKLFEYEPVRGQIEYGQICGTSHSLKRRKLKN